MTHTQVPLSEELRKKIQADVDAQAQEMCIIICNECSKACASALNYSVRTGKSEIDASFIKTLISCSEICSLNALWLARDFELHNKLCQACAYICESCAKYCDQHNGNKIMSECTDICQRCAQSCLRMLAH